MVELGTMPVRLLCILLLLLPVLTVPAPRAAAQESVSARVGRAVEAKAHKGVRFSAAVWDAATGERLYARQAHEARRPASVMKLATTAAALLRFGADHRLVTRVEAAGRPRADGTLAGDLTVRGGGDPGMAAHFHEPGAADAMAQLARDVLAAGVLRVEGDLVLDDSAFTGPRRHLSWDHRPGRYEWWRAPVSALVLNDNCLDLTAAPGPEPGAPAVIVVVPQTGVVRIDNRLVTTADRSRHLIRYVPGDEEGVLVATGAVWTGSTGYTEPIACVDPPKLFGDVFLRALQAQGVQVTGAVRIVEQASDSSLDPGPAPPSVRAAPVVLAQHGTSVGDVVAVCNRRSQNLYAEVLLRALGAADGDGGTFEGGAAAVRRALGFDGPGQTFRQVDGCGLSRDNSMSADDVGRILLRVYRSRQRLAFLDSLARPGDPDGTLRKRFRGSRYEGRVLAKTGTLRDTSSLAGFVQTAQGGVLAFAVLCEGDVSRSHLVQDALVDALVAP